MTAILQVNTGILTEVSHQNRQSTDVLKKGNLSGSEAMNR